MRTLLLVALLGCATEPPPPSAPASSVPTEPTSLVSYETRGVQELTDVLKQEGIILVDVRTSPEFARGHIAGAISLPMAGEGFDPRGIEIHGHKDRAATIYVISLTGRRSAEAAAQFAAAGFTSVIHVEGGVKGWVDLGQPLET
jgi:rhodanese-related sulfurtransferase